MAVCVIGDILFMLMYCNVDFICVRLYMCVRAYVYLCVCVAGAYPGFQRGGCPGGGGGGGGQSTSGPILGGGGGGRGIVTGIDINFPNSTELTWNYSFASNPTPLVHATI